MAVPSSRDGNRAADVITRLRALFSKKEFTLEPLDINDVTREVVALSLNDLQRNRVVLQSEFAHDLPLITGDRIQLQQVVLNLLRNASDAMASVDDRPRHLLIRTLRDEDDSVRVAVRDAGVGLDVQSMNNLWAEPNEGPAATFSFSIPRALETPAAGPQAPA